MVRPCVARVIGDRVVRSCINVSGLIVERFCCSEPSWISARNRADWRTGLDRAKRVTSFRPHREDRSPSLRSLSQTSAGSLCYAGMTAYLTFLSSTDLAFPVPTVRLFQGVVLRTGQGRRTFSAARLGLGEAEHGAKLS